MPEKTQERPDKIFGTKKRPSDLLIALQASSANIATVSFSQDQTRILGSSVEDYNDIHRLSEIAQKYGLKNTLIMGIGLAGYTEYFARRNITNALSSIKERDYKPDLKISKIVGSIKSPAFPGESINWKVDSLAHYDNRDLVTMTILGYVGEKEGDKDFKRVSRLTVNIEDKFSSLEPLVNPVYSKRFIPDREKIDGFFRGIGVNGGNYTPHILSSGLWISTVLDLLREHTGKRDGEIHKLSFNFLNDIEEGIPLQGDIFYPERPPQKKDGKYFYKIRGATGQRSKPVSQAEITCVTGYDFDYRPPPHNGVDFKSKLKT
jgi:hypothetical protein